MSFSISKEWLFCNLRTDIPAVIAIEEPMLVGQHCDSFVVVQVLVQAKQMAHFVVLVAINLNFVLNFQFRISEFLLKMH